MNFAADFNQPVLIYEAETRSQGKQGGGIRGQDWMRCETFAQRPKTLKRVRPPPPSQPAV